MVIYWSFLIWVKSIAFPSLFSVRLEGELLSKCVLFLFRASATLLQRRSLNSLFWHQENRRKSFGKHSAYLHICTSVIGVGYPNNMSEHFSEAETEKSAVSPENFRLWAITWFYISAAGMRSYNHFVNWKWKLEQVKICPRVWCH